MIKYGFPGDTQRKYHKALSDMLAQPPASGKVLQEFRARKGLRQEDLANLFGIAVQTVRAKEAGRAPITNAERLALDMLDKLIHNR